MTNWASEENKKIIQMTKEGLTEKEIAEKIGKPAQGIKEKRKALSLRRKGIVVWTEQNIKALKYLVSMGEDDKKIADILGNNKTKEAVRKKRKELGL